MKQLLIISIFFLAACNDSSKTTSGDGDSTGASIDAPGSNTASQDRTDVSGCYLQVVGRDSIHLTLQQQGDSLTGTMAFDNYQKDASRGTIKGSIQNGLVVLWYDFFSEGMRSMMEIILKPESGALIRGTGEMDYRGDTAVFKSHKGLDFDEKSRMLKTDCSENK
jgi:hypothetical protein